MEGISNLYIENILLPRTSTFLGVFSCDKIPRSLCNKRKFSVIVNLSKFNQKGTHWVAIFRDQSKLIYYDAVGLPLINKDITRFLKSFDQEYTFNTFESQCFQMYPLIVGMRLKVGHGDRMPSISFHSFLNL